MHWKYRRNLGTKGVYSSVPPDYRDTATPQRFKPCRSQLTNKEKLIQNSCSYFYKTIVWYANHQSHRGNQGQCTINLARLPAQPGRGVQPCQAAESSSSARPGRASPISASPDQSPAQGRWARAEEEEQPGGQGCCAQVIFFFLFLPPSTSYFLQQWQPTGWCSSKWSWIKSPAEDL